MIAYINETCLDLLGIIFNLLISSQVNESQKWFSNVINYMATMPQCKEIIEKGNQLSVWCSTTRACRDILDHALLLKISLKSMGSLNWTLNSIKLHYCFAYVISHRNTERHSSQAVSFRVYNLHSIISRLLRTCDFFWILARGAI